MPPRTRPTVAVDAELLDALQAAYATQANTLRCLTTFGRALLEAGGVESLPAGTRQAFEALLEGATPMREAIRTLEKIEAAGALEALLARRQES